MKELFKVSMAIKMRFVKRRVLFSMMRPAFVSWAMEAPDAEFRAIRYTDDLMVSAKLLRVCNSITI